MASSGNSSGGGGFQPFSAPNYIPPAPAAPTPVPSNTVAGTLPFTRVNSTNDPRVLWEDGQSAIIFAGDFPANTGMGRSKTRKTLPDAIAAPIDPALVTGAGAGSKGDLIKVWLAELLQRPVGGVQGLQAPPVGRLPSSPRNLDPTPPRIAKSGSYKGMVIPDFPHTCTACGGKYYQGMFDAVHPTPDGKCPKGGEKKRR